ncbi:hypothetical protein AB0H28_22885 [Micromonospora sp. NPDC050980]|uniref:hypothetical protein n=1 Tax=Micromonospora sp. NPDC050980 TaxID=3155161 RepID=UPI0034114114
MTSQEPSSKASHQTWRRLVTPLLAASVVVGLALTVGTVMAGREKTAALASSAASVTNTEPGPARCPQTWTDTAPTKPGTDVLVPVGATEALLCSYRHEADPPLSLAASRRITNRVDELTTDLNGLPTSPPAGTVCLLGQSTEHAFVFGYPGQRAAVIRLSNCAWQREGATRYGGDIRKVTAYWGARWND